MLNDPDLLIRLFVAIATFGLVMSLWLIGVVLWASRKKKQATQFQQRLDFAGASSVKTGGRVLRLWHEGQEAVTIVPGFSVSGVLPRVQRVCSEAGWRISAPVALIRLGIMLGIIGFIAGTLTSSIAVGIISAAGGLMLFWIWLTQKISHRTHTFERQLIDALDLASRSLRVGHPLVTSFHLIAEEIPAPVGTLFAEVCQQQSLGMPMDQALRTVADASTSEDLKLFATSVVIQLSSGGNLADMMERLSHVIRERQRLARRVKVLTAQTQFSKRVLLALPFLVFVALNLINPNYMRPLYSTMAGQIIMMVAAVLLLVGWAIMNWLSKLSY